MDSRAIFEGLIVNRCYISWYNYFSFEFSEIAKINERQKAKGIEEYIEEKPKNNDYSDLTEEEKHIITKITSDPISFEGLLEVSGIQADKLTSIITMLEIKGKIKRYFILLVLT